LNRNGCGVAGDPGVGRQRKQSPVCGARKTARDGCRHLSFRFSTAAQDTPLDFPIFHARPHFFCGPSGDNGFEQTTTKSSVYGTCAHFSSMDQKK